MAAHLPARGKLPLMGDETLEDYRGRLRDAPYLDRYAVIRRAVLSNIGLELPFQLAEVFVQEASEACESAPARLVSVKAVVAARRVHIVTDDDNADRVFLRAIDYGGRGGPLTPTYDQTSEICIVSARHSFP
jgi:hypothetical protein